MDLLCLPNAVLQPSGELLSISFRDRLWCRCTAGMPAGSSTATLRSKLGNGWDALLVLLHAGMPTTEGTAGCF